MVPNLEFFSHPPFGTSEVRPWEELQELQKLSKDGISAFNSISAELTQVCGK